VIVLSDYPRWMFRKNLIKFFIGLVYYLYYFYSGCMMLGNHSKVITLKLMDSPRS